MPNPDEQRTIVGHIWWPADRIDRHCRNNSLLARILTKKRRDLYSRVCDPVYGKKGTGKKGIGKKGTVKNVSVKKVQGKKVLGKKGTGKKGTR